MTEQTMPPQKQSQPGRQHAMDPAPEVGKNYRAAGKLEGRVALVTGGDSGIGRSVAVLFAKEGADVAVVYLEETEDADATKRLVEAEGRRCLTMAGDVGQESFCAKAVERTVAELGRLDILVNNAAEQHKATSLEEITAEQLEKTFRTNIFGYFFMAKAALKHLKEGSAIINTTSITAYQGNPGLMDYASTKGAIVAFTRSLSQSLISQGIRVNGVAPGPIWTPLIPATFSEEDVAKFGQDTPMKRPGQPDEVATCYVFLASDDSSYMAGQILHPNGGQVVNG
ncbi:MAG: SDR family oxidoreductase [Candidatus Dormibacteraeota bacterium]|uniref:SDR family oxidoreductase n=1 Tax=Candidatus Dormiibacter inghamiae TaxID=3127013 RepID=A0A934KJN7_9BACT|nr:SDR family oxidoreductase [Candidatus Dormibacteraeota bacterium]MBJ7604743.1 SDR family oxidoreductase [Candidatus Dormibacteraeota bacterium]